MGRRLKAYGTFFSQITTTQLFKEHIMILVAYSHKDIAGTNITKQLLRNHAFNKTETTFEENSVYAGEINKKKVKLVALKDETVYAQTLLKHFDNPELVVFLSRHSSQSGRPTLSVHTPGNFGNAELGGIPRTLSVSPARAMRDALKALKEFKTEMNLDYEVSYECTHHGPSLDVPTMFVELGSSPEQWTDSKAAEAVAKAALEAIANFHATEQKAVIGIGGPHYNTRFTQMALSDEAVFGHMIPKYAIPEVNSEIISQCIERTLEEVDYAILDWKGIKSQDKLKLLDTLSELEVPYEKA